MEPRSGLKSGPDLGKRALDKRTTFLFLLIQEKGLTVLLDGFQINAPLTLLLEVIAAFGIAL